MIRSDIWLAPLQAGGLIPTGSRVVVFQSIYLAFLLIPPQGFDQWYASVENEIEA